MYIYYILCKECGKYQRQSLKCKSGSQQKYSMPRKCEFRPQWAYSPTKLSCRQIPGTVDSGPPTCSGPWTKGRNKPPMSRRRSLHVKLYVPQSLGGAPWDSSQSLLSIPGDWKAWAKGLWSATKFLATEMSSQVSPVGPWCKIKLGSQGRKCITKNPKSC